MIYHLVVMVGVTKAVYDKYSSYTAPCPKNWLLPGNSIYT